MTKGRTKTFYVHNDRDLGLSQYGDLLRVRMYDDDIESDSDTVEDASDECISSIGNTIKCLSKTELEIFIQIKKKLLY